MLRDRLVVGIRDIALSKKMQTDPTVTLESAKKFVRQKQVAKDQERARQTRQLDIGKQSTDADREKTLALN